MFGSAPALRAAAAAAALLLAAPPVSGAERAFTFERGPTDRRQVALTFDGGSDAGDTVLILEALERRGVRATFFLTGTYVSRFPELARRIAAAGHEVGNHTWSHPHLTTWSSDRRQRTLPGVDRAFLLRELAATSDAWEETTGLPMAPLWRAPFGELNPTLGAWAAEAGWAHVGWTRDARGRRTLDSLDWVADRSSRLYLSSAAIVERLLAFGDAPDGLNGGIVLMHLCTRREDPGAARLGELVDALVERGYRLVTIWEMLADPDAPAPAVAAAVAAASAP